MIPPDDAQSNVPRSQRRRSMRGMLLVVAMFALGGLVLWGLFLAPRAVSPRAPTEVAWAAPDRPIRVVWCPVDRSSDVPSIAARLEPLKPDFVLLYDVPARELPALATALGMDRSYHTNNYVRAQNAGGRKSNRGHAILSRHPLYDGTPLRNERRDEDFGVLVSAVVDGVKFLVAIGEHSDDHFLEERNAPRDEWFRRQRPPFVIGGLSRDEAWFVVAGQVFQTSRDWKVAGSGGDGNIQWVDLAAASAATRPSAP